MFKLTYFKARYVIGFMSGFGAKTFELDLKKLQDKDILVIFGDNASGKSTFLSLVHPWHQPSDGRTKFIIPGKEGLLVREYTSDDGTTILTKCVYTPKGEDSHSVKCYFQVEKPGDKEPVEMNPNGNLSSYQSLLYTYFGINKEFLNFSTYNNSVTSIIGMNDTERKNAVGSLVPNMGRFEIAYHTVNEKYKELRNLIRNVSDKILRMRDEESLRADLNRVTKELDMYILQREDQIKKAAKIDGRLKELTKGADSDEMLSEYRDSVQHVELLDHACGRIIQELHRIYDQLDIEYEQDSVMFDGINDVSSKVLKYERKVAVTETETDGFQQRLTSYTEQMSDLESRIMELEMSLHAAKTQNLDELMELRDHYKHQLKQLSYDGSDHQYDGMSYDEVIMFSNNVMIIHNSIQAMYDEYGELLTEYFSQVHDKGYEEKQLDSLRVIHARIETNSAKKDHLYRKLIEMEQYRKFQTILDQRPKSCTIDSCPFIANALKWEAMADEVEQLKREYEDIGILIAEDTSSIDDYEKRIAIYNHAQILINQLAAMEPLLKKYYKITISDVYQSIVQANWRDVLDILRLKEIAAILSEKDRYLEITTRLLPEVEHNIELAKLYAKNQSLVQDQYQRLQDEYKRLKEESSQYRLHVAVGKNMLGIWKKKLNQWRRIQELLDDYQKTSLEQVELEDALKEREKEIQQIKELKEKRKELKRNIDELTELANERMPVQQQLHTELIQLDQLHMEKLTIERDFLVVDVIRSIIQPGKGLRKELINIYMYDIYQTANQLLLHTFNGNLYLKEFIITDKSFIIPFVYNGTESPDIIFASASQQSAIAISISMAILSKILGDYGIACFDEADGPFSPANRSIFIDILTTQARYIGLKQSFFITQHQNEYTESDSVGFIAFPGGNIKRITEDDLIVVK